MPPCRLAHPEPRMQARAQAERVWRCRFCGRRRHIAMAVTRPKSTSLDMGGTFVLVIGCRQRAGTGHGHITTSTAQ